MLQKNYLKFLMVFFFVLGVLPQRPYADVGRMCNQNWCSYCASNKQNFIVDECLIVNSNQIILAQNGEKIESQIEFGALTGVIVFFYSDKKMYGLPNETFLDNLKQKNLYFPLAGEFEETVKIIELFTKHEEVKFCFEDSQGICVSYPLDGLKEISKHWFYLVEKYLIE